jgi:hypothetical protein
VGAGAGVAELVRAALRAHHARPTPFLPPPIATLRESSPVYGRRRRRQHPPDPISRSALPPRQTHSLRAALASAPAVPHAPTGVSR